MQILTKTKDEFEFKNENNTYKYSKVEVRDVDEDTGDRFTEYQVVLIFTSGNEDPRCYMKVFRDDKQARDDVFANLKPEEITDFTDWKRCS